MKIQPIDSQTLRNETVKPVMKSRLKRLFDRQFPNVLKISSTEKQNAGDVGLEFEPTSACLAKMVQNFIEESNDKQSAAKCVKNRCNCFNGNNDDSSDDEFDFDDISDSLKSLIPCNSVTERNLLADISKIIDKNKINKRKDDLRKIVTDSLLSLGYNASICKSRWDKSASYPAGEYEYIDVVVEGERVLVDIEFRSEFEIARPTGHYKMILQSLPLIFVGKADRLQQIISIISEAVKLSLKKKGMHIPPWRKSEYMRGKWLSPHTRTTTTTTQALEQSETEDINNVRSIAEESDCGDFELVFVEKLEWEPPAIKPKSGERGTKVVTGLASLFKERG